MPDKSESARQLVLLGILLQCLHIIFGVTAIIGVLITQTRMRSTHGTVYQSQLKWQFLTFWIGLAGYALGAYFWSAQSNHWVIVAVLVLIYYRLIVSIRAWQHQRAITRWL